jgi:dTDP-D-glucose 4,6-dehydratase
MHPILVTGGAGFIGGEFVRQWIAEEASPVVTLDKLTSAGNLDSPAVIAGSQRHIFCQGDRGDPGRVRGLLQKHRPRAIVNFTAESHVDRSIDVSKIQGELGRKPGLSFNEAIRQTVSWYLDNTAWMATIANGGSRRDRIGLSGHTA